MRVWECTHPGLMMTWALSSRRLSVCLMVVWPPSSRRLSASALTLQGSILCNPEHSKFFAKVWHYVWRTSFKPKNLLWERFEWVHPLKIPFFLRIFCKICGPASGWSSQVTLPQLNITVTSYLVINVLKLNIFRRFQLALFNTTGMNVMLTYFFQRVWGKVFHVLKIRVQ